MVNSATVVADVSNQVPNSWRITIVGYLLVAVSTQHCFFCMNIYDYIPHFSKDLKTQGSQVSRPKILGESMTYQSPSLFPDFFFRRQIVLQDLYGGDLEVPG